MATIDFEKKSGNYGSPQITVESRAHEYGSKFKLYRHNLNSYSHQYFFCFKFKGLVKVLFAYEEFKTDKVIFVEAYYGNDGSEEPVIFGFVTTKNVRRYFRFTDFANGKISNVSKDYISEDQLRKELERGVACVTPQLTLAERDAIDISYKTGVDPYKYKGNTIHSSRNDFSDKYEFVQYKYSSLDKIIEGEFAIRYMELKVNFVGNVEGEYCNQVLLYVSRSNPNTPILIGFGISSREMRYMLFSDFIEKDELTVNVSALAKIEVNVDPKQTNYLVEGQLLSLLYQFNPEISGITIINTKKHESYDNVIVSENPAIGDFRSFTHKPVGEFQHTLIESGYLPFVIKEFNPSEYASDNLEHVVLYYSIAASANIPLMIEVVTNGCNLHISEGFMPNMSEFFVLSQILEVSKYYDGSTFSDDWSVKYELADMKTGDVEGKLKELLKIYARPMELMPKPRLELGALVVVVCVVASMALVAALALLARRCSRRAVKLIKKLYHIH